MIRQAFVHARIAKDVDDIRLVAPVQRQGSSWTTTVQLPPGTAASKVVGQREQLASALQLPAHRLLVTSDDGHAGRVRLRASDEDPLSGVPVANPLVLAPRPVDLWSPLPIGVDVTGRVVSVSLVFSGLLVGGLPRSGKSVACANILVGGLLDPHCQLWLVDGKGLDSRPLIPHATHHVGADIDDFAAMMLVLEKEMDRRYQRLASLELDKLNRKVCHAEMPLILLSIDELARYTANQDKTAKRAVNTLRNIVSVGPAAGIIPVLATQKPSSKIVPTDIRDLIPLRIAVACSTRAQSNTILGDEATVSAADLPKSTKGAAWLVHEGATMIRPYLVDGPALREVAGKVNASLPVAESVARVLAAMGDADRMRSADLAARLGTTQNDLAAMLSQYGVRPRQLGGTGNPRGYKRADILAAIGGATRT
jgi:S-DNA-T family DNA segregation ATPase FtsK/SpoIIIE